MDIVNADKASRKKPYAAPTVVAVSLTPEEVSLGSCKASSGTAGSKTAGTPCRLCGIVIGS